MKTPCNFNRRLGLVLLVTMVLISCFQANRLPLGFFNWLENKIDYLLNFLVFLIPVPCVFEISAWRSPY
jgi:hypothetical protein